MKDGLKKGKKIKPLLKQLLDFPEAVVARTATDFNKAFHAKIFTLFAASESELHAFSEKFLPHYGYCFGFMKNDEGQWFLDWEGVGVVREWIVSEIERNGSQAIFNIYDEWLEDWKKYEKVCKKVDITDLAELSDKNFFKLFEQFYVGYLTAGSVAYMADTFMSTGETDWLEEKTRRELERIGIDETSSRQTVRSLLNPLVQSYTVESEWKIVKIGWEVEKIYQHLLPSFVKLKKDNPAIVSMLESHARYFYWIRNNYFNVEVLGAAHFYRELQKRSAELNKLGETFHGLLEAREKEIGAERRKRDELFSKLNSLPRAQALLKVAWLFAKWKDDRKKGSYIGMHYFNIFFSELSQRTGYSKYNLTFLIFQEVASLLFGKRDFLKVIQERKKQTFFAITSEGYYIIGGKKADRYFKYAGGGAELASEFKGVSASGGFASGRARIIRKTEDMNLFKKGEIIVTNQTTPEFVPIMKKAAAIITEQGGIISHAAVISRELGVPCIIGIKTATQVFRDGDLVEVDADRGVVRLLKK